MTKQDEAKTEVDVKHTAIAATVLAGTSEPRQVDAQAEDPVFEVTTRYVIRRVLGAGGMGEVRLVSDSWIGRDIAMKVVKSGHGSHAETRGRFLREARVQGQLEHPSVVPVYDLGKTSTGESFFTMKRIGGHTFERVIDGLREGDGEIVAQYTRRKWLSAMSQVCLAIAYAHSRGVVHRDLKPSNVMLGDFGEVYVLDWGVAKIAGVAETLKDSISGEIDSVQTHAGALVGTPGYMSPEQARGEVDAIGPATDIYALGAMLFELLTLEPLHQGKSVAALLASTQKNARAPREIDPNVPPELDAICTRATQLDPEARFDSARAMHEALEAFLAGERDAERRKELASALVEKGRAALAKANEGGPDAERLRTEGMRALADAVAFDPTEQGALRAIHEVLLSPATTLPPDAEKELKQVELEDRARANRRAAWMYGAWLVLAPSVFITGVRNWYAFAALLLFNMIAIGYSAWMSTKPERSAPRFMRVMLLLNFALITASTAIFGPFILTPGIAGIGAASTAIAIRANAQTRRGMLMAAILSVFGPFALEWFGVFSPAYTFEKNAIVIHPILENFDPRITPIALCVVTFMQLVLPIALVYRAIDTLISAERKNFTQAWRLRQLLPPATRG